MEIFQNRIKNELLNIISKLQTFTSSRISCNIYKTSSTLTLDPYWISLALTINPNMSRWWIWEENYVRTQSHSETVTACALWEARDSNCFWSRKKERCYCRNPEAFRFSTFTLRTLSPRVSVAILFLQSDGTNECLQKVPLPKHCWVVFLFFIFCRLTPVWEQMLTLKRWPTYRKAVCFALVPVQSDFYRDLVLSNTLDNVHYA